MSTQIRNLEHYRTVLAEEVVTHRREVPKFSPLNINPWLAMSLMQKAIRRGRLGLALRASATLLRDSPERFWRRVCVTAFEDKGKRYGRYRDCTRNGD
jgi:hypothetical protein